MADYPPPFNNWEAKQRAASKPRERVDSTSSYVVLRETAKHKQGVNSSKGNAKETKKRKTPKKEETSNRENRRNVTTSNRGHFQDKGRLEHRSCCRGLCFHRLLQFLVLFFSVAALALVILMVLGILGPADRCHACNKEGELTVLLTIFSSVDVVLIFQDHSGFSYTRGACDFKFVSCKFSQAQ